VTVLVHGLLLSQRMHAELAKALAAHGNRVVTLDLLGHGRSDRPQDMWRYSMTTFGAEVVALLDHLEVDEAVVLGTSLGANAALEAASLTPERLRGMVIEMPVLDNALLGCALAFTPLLVALTFGEPVMRAVGAAARRVPRLPWQLDIVLDTVRQDPSRARRCCRACSSGAPPRTAASGGPSRRPRW
jgi:pimeloyl-ACP methyl ester carboxylesterase